MVGLWHTLNRKQRRSALHAARKAGVVFTQSVPQSDWKDAVELEPQSLRSRFRKASRAAKALVSAIATLVALVGIFALQPKVLIDPYSSTDISTPFNEQFVVTNESVYPIV